MTGAAWPGALAADVRRAAERRRQRAGAAPARSLVKRSLDVFGATFGLLMISPIMLLAALAVLVTSGRPVFYWQDRVGLNGRAFRMCKFRSMRRDAESETGPVWAHDHDVRCTPVGRFLRQTNVDELPQLWNVLKGEMSLVGPRPERPCFVERFREELPGYDRRHDVPLGMTGWAQVHGWRGRTSLRKRLQYDLDYARRWSPWLDVLVLLMTVQHVFWGKTQWGRPGQGARALRMGTRRVRRDEGRS